MITDLERSVLDSRLEGPGTVISQVIAGNQAFLALEGEWKALHAASRTHNPFLCWEWVEAWVRHFSGPRLRTIVMRSQGRVIGIAPFHLNRYLIGPGLYASALQLLGPKEVQHLLEVREPLVLPGCEHAVMQALLAASREIAGWDWIELSAQGSGLPALDMALAGVHAEGLVVHQGAEVDIPVMTLEPTWEAQRQVLKRNIKESIRHCYNALRRDQHEHTFIPDAGQGASVEAAERLVELHRRRALLQDRRWHRDHFADEPIRRFEVDALSMMHYAGKARFAELHVGGRAIAARACLESNGSLYLYYSGFDPAWWKYSVMTLLVTEVIKDAIGRGLGSVNFSPGIDDSKSRWGVTIVPMRGAVLVKANPVSRARYELLRARKRIRQPLHRKIDRLVGAFRQK